MLDGNQCEAAHAGQGIQHPVRPVFFRAIQARQEYWSGLPFPSPGDLPDPGIKPKFPALAGESLTTKPPGKPQLLSLLQHCPNHNFLKSSFQQS